MFSFSFFTFNISAQTINLTAEEGLELNQTKKTISAIKNAKIERGDMTLIADKIIAYYKDGKDNKPQIYKVEALGDVQINSSKEKIETKKALYNLETGQMVLTGSPTTRLYYDGVILSSNNPINYNHITGIAETTDASIKQDKRILTAPKMTAHFEETNGKFGLALAKATGGVKLETETESLTGDNAVYDAKTGFATITNSVSLKRGNEATLDGGLLEYNMKTGITRLHPKKGETKIHGTFNIDSKNKEE
ncbi:MAG: hypothetical protein LBR35_00420 [Rickettsiales bacterium]|nr:hypothetical protein [Rickettsiales bacterium]